MKRLSSTLMLGLAVLLVLGALMIPHDAGASLDPACGEQADGTWDDRTWTCCGTPRDCTVSKVCDPDDGEPFNKR